MTIMCLSLSHRFVPAEVLEKLAVPAGELGEVLAQVHAVPGVDEAVVLSTCNRVEVYAAVSGPGSAPGPAGRVTGRVTGAVADLLAARGHVRRALMGSSTSTPCKSSSASQRPRPRRELPAPASRLRFPDPR
jgi:hypothetical protein